MFKDYLEDKQESKIIFDDSSIDTIEKILSNHDNFYIEFPKYEIPIKSSSLNKIFSLSKISKEENILFSFRTPENELTKSYPDLLESINLNKSNEKKNENKKKQIVKHTVNKRPGSMKFPPNLRNELKKNLKKDNNIYPIKENEAQSDDEGERSKIIFKISPPVLSTDKITNTSVSLSPKFYGCIGENYDLVVKIWLFFYFSLIFISFFLFGYKIYCFRFSLKNSIYFTFLFLDLFNLFIGFLGLKYINDYIKLNLEDFSYHSNIINYLIVFDIFFSSFFLTYCFYFLNNAFLGNTYMLNSLYEYLNLTSLALQICCLYLNLHMDKFYIENDKLLPLKETLL